jgi:putative membrane protein
VRSGSLTDPGLVEGLALLGDGLEQSTAAVQALQTGAASAASGSAGLATGAAGVAAGLGQASGGAEQLAVGASGLAVGTRAQADGVGALAAGTDALASGAEEAARGSAALAGGLQRLQVEGVDALGAAVLEASVEPALAAAWVAATDARVADALPYGPPQDAVGFAAYRHTMPATSAAGTPAWQWWALGAGVLAAVGWAAWRRLATPPPAPR